MFNRGADKRMDGQMDVWKFPPVFYRTPALWGRCPKRKKKSENFFEGIYMNVKTNACRRI